MVDDNNRKKFIDLFKTWKSATTSSGLPLFPKEPIDKIEQFLIKASTIYQQQMQTSRSSTPQLTNQSLFPIVDKLLYLTNQRLLANPQDSTIHQKLQIIGQLKQALQTENLPPQSLAQVQKQLDDMTKHEESYLRNTPVIHSPTPRSGTLQPHPSQHSSQHPPQQQQQQQSQPRLQQPQSSLQPPVVPNLSNLLQKNGPPEKKSNPLGLLNNIMSNGGLKLPSTKPKISPGVPNTDLSSLLSNLEKKGLVKSKAPITSTSVLKSLLTKKSGSSSPSTSQVKVSEFAKFDLDSKFLSVDPTDIYVNTFFTKRPNKCGQCGKRFDSSIEGQNLRREHLDWHFRVNKKLKEGRNPQSRNWYLDDEAFVNFRDDEIFSSENHEEPTVKEEKVELKRSYVTVPSDSTDMSVVCGICKETLKGTYDDELGEWIWDNAVKSNGKVFHSNCFQETSKAGLLANLIPNKRKREDDKKFDLNMLKNIVSNVKLEEGPQFKKEKI